MVIDQDGSALVRDSKSKSGDDTALVVGSSSASPVAIVRHLSRAGKGKGKARESSLRAHSVPSTEALEIPESDTEERDVEEIVSDPKQKVSHLSIILSLVCILSVIAV